MTMARRVLVVVLVLLALAGAAGAAVLLQSGASTDLLKINANKAALFILGSSDRATYRATATGLATTALYNMSIEASASQGFKLVRWCVGVSNATAAAPVTVSVNRRTTASSAGTLATAEGTASPAVSKMDSADANFPGIVRITSTLGTLGALIDGQSFAIGEVGAGTADPPSADEFCKEYGKLGEKMPVIPAGIANGVSINVSAPGAGGLASGSITATVIVE